jgi:hypothetical protein
MSKSRRVQPQPHREEKAEDRIRARETENATLKAAARRARLRIAEEADRKAEATRREREDAEGRREV